MRSKNNTVILGVLFAMAILVTKPARALESNDEVPLAASAGVTREELAAYAAAHARVTLSDFLEVSRPGIENDEKLKHLIEKAQTAWLSKSPDQARLIFHEIARLSLEADWRDSQREVLHYAHLRMAQTAILPTEREEWLERAAFLFPDVKPDASLFPPPLLDEYKAKLQAAQMSSKEFEPARSFPQYRYVLVNGRRYEITAELKIPLNTGVYRITAYSDSLPPISEHLTASQLEMFQANPQMIARGPCENPENSRLPSNAGSEMTFLFPNGCVRTLTAAGWQSENASSASLDLKSLSRKSDPMPFSDPSEKVAAHARNSWLLIAGAALAAGIVTVMAEQQSNSHGSASSPQAVHRNGF